MIRRVCRARAAPRADAFALATVLGALTILFGVGLMSIAGYLISRAAEQPAVLSLTVAIVAVRFFGLARPIVRYLDRLASHDLAFRVLGRVRVRVYERLEPLAPARAARGTGTVTSSRAWSPTSTHCSTCICAGSCRRARSGRRELCVGRRRRGVLCRGQRSSSRPACSSPGSESRWLPARSVVAPRVRRQPRAAS